MLIGRPKSEIQERTEQENKAHTAVHATIAGLVFCVAVAGFFHAAPYHDAAPVVAPPVVVTPEPAPTQQVAPADPCEATSNGNACVPDSIIFNMMDATPDATEDVPPVNPAATDTEKI